MKKFILFIVLILGFISENKAQFPASSEIYYYLCVANTDGSSVDYSYIVKFYSNSIKRNYISKYQYEENKINDCIREMETHKPYSYDSSESTSKYVAYSTIYNNGDGYWLFFSKDRSEMIHVKFFKYTSLTVKYYFKRVTKQDLINKNKPNFDFLE